MISHFRSIELLRSIAIVMVMAFSLSFLNVSHAYAQHKIAVVDVQKVLNDSKAAKSVQEQLRKKREMYQDELAAKEKELKALQDSVVAAEGSSKEEIQKKRVEFEKKLITMRNLVKQRRGALELAASKALEDIRNEVVKVVAELAQENSYTIVITRQNVILAEKELEITDEVMKRLNKKVKTIKLEIKE